MLPAAVDRQRSAMVVLAEQIQTGGPNGTQHRRLKWFEKHGTSL
jgi:hypothetical protein